MAITDKNLVKKTLARLASWMDACKIKYIVEPDFSVSVATTEGRPVKIVVVLEKNEGPLVAAPAYLELLASDFCSAKREVSFGAFHAITEILGYGSPIPVERGAPTPRTYRGKTKDGTEIEGAEDLTVWRHNAFFNAANPAPEVFSYFDDVISSCIKFFWGKNFLVCERLGISKGDLRTHALMWTTTFWSEGRVFNDCKDDANKRILYEHLRTRFGELHAQFAVRRSANVIVDGQTVAAALGMEYGYEFGAGDRPTRCAITPEAPDLEALEQYKVEHNELDLTDEGSRAKSAKALLSKSLAAMPHDALIDTLKAAVDSIHFCPDTRTEAAKQLKLHVKNCSTCAAAPPPPPPLRLTPAAKRLRKRLDRIQAKEDVSTGDSWGGAEEV